MHNILFVVMAFAGVACSGASPSHENTETDGLGESDKDMAEEDKDNTGEGADNDESDPNETDVELGEPADAPRPALIPDVPAPALPEFENLTCDETTPVLAEGRLLTRLQYNNTISDLFDGQVTGTWTTSFPAENEVLGFRTSAEFHRATPWFAEAQMVASESVASKVRAKLDVIAPCAADATEDLAPGSPGAEAAVECLRGFLATYGLRAFRRPLTAIEEQTFVSLFEHAIEEEGTAYGFELVIQALLQSPQFLYRFEVPGSSDAANGETELVDSYALASRISYLFWNSIPDDELFEVAKRGDLLKKDVLRAQADRLLTSPKASSSISDFSEQWLGLNTLESAVRYDPMTNATNNHYAASWEASVSTFVSQLYENNSTFRDLMLSSNVFIDQRLASLYGASLPDGTPDGTFASLTLSEERTGLLTQPGLMALLAHTDQSSPILRGVFVRDKILCQPVPPPPPDVEAAPPVLDRNATTRERLAQHTADTTCAGCHSLLDPIGLALENYDELGRFRTTENGLDIDTSGSLVGLREDAIEGQFLGPRELAERLSDSEQAATCFVTQWYRYSMGRVEQTDDLCSIRDLVDAFIASDGALRHMLLQLVETSAFRYRKFDPLGETALAGEDQQ